MCLILFFINLNIPILSWLLIIVLPFIIKFLGYLKFSKYIFKSKYFKVSSLLLVMFVLINFSVSFFHGLYGSKSLTYLIFPILMIPIMFFTAVFVNYKKIPFYPYNIIIINLSLFFGGTLLVFLSVGHYFSWSLSLIDLFFSRDSLSVISSKVGRSVPNFWFPQLEMNAASLDIFSSLGISLFGFITCQLYFSKNKIQNIPLLLFISLIFLMSFYSSIALGSRSPIVVMVFAFFISIMYVQYVSMLKSSGNKKLTKLFFNVIIVILFISFFTIGTYDFSKVISDTNFGTRFAEKGLDSERYDAWIVAIGQMWEFPWGGRLMKLPSGLFFVHNIWLDQLYDAGIIPMILLIAFHVVQVPILLDFFKLHLPLTVSVFALCILVSLLTSFIQAPVIQSSIPFFATSCFFFGSIMRLTIDYRLSKHFIDTHD